jgi:hypothetical protein
VIAGGPDLAVPAYFYPIGHESEWQMLTAGRRPLRYVVVNPHNGPGSAADPAYERVCTQLQRAQVRQVGYVDADYGRRSTDDVLAEARSYRDRYGITGVFLDQASSGLESLTAFETYTVALRTMGTRFIVLNPGTYPNLGYFRIANQVVAFEGSWPQYLDLQIPQWSQRIPARRIAHYVWSVPAELAANPTAAVDGRHVGTVVLSTLAQPNPWAELPLAVRADRVPAGDVGSTSG